MAPPKKRGSTTKKGTTRLLDLPPVGKVPDPKAGRWDAKGVKISDDLLRKKYRERARKAALTKRKKAQDLKKSLGQVYKDVAEMMEEPVVKGKRPLAGAALKAQQDKIKREAEKAAKEEEARLQREITEQAEREIREQLDQEKAERDRYLKLRDAKREARAKITKTLTQMRQKKAGIAQQGAIQAEQQVEADQDDTLDEVEQASAQVVPAPTKPRSALGSARNFFRAAKHAYDNPRWVRKANQPNQTPTGAPQKGFYYDEYGDLWKDGQKVTGKNRTTKSKAATEYESAKQDALNKPTGNPTARAEDVAKWKAATGSDVMSIRTQTGRKAMFTVNMVDKQGKPMDVVFEREVSELEKLAGLQKAQDKWEKDEQRKKDAKENKHTVDNFRLKDYIKAPQMFKTAAHAFLKPAKDMLGELKNVALGILGIGGIFAVLYGLKKAADNAVPIINGIVDSVLAVEEGFYRMTFQSDKADEIHKQRERNKSSMDPSDQKVADETSTVTKVAGGAAGLWGASKLARAGMAAYKYGRTALGLSEAATGAEAAGGAALGTGTAATAGLAVLGVEGYMGVYKPVWGQAGKDTTEVMKMAASGDPTAAILYTRASSGDKPDEQIALSAAKLMTDGIEGIPKSGRDYETNKKLAAEALIRLKGQNGGTLPTGMDAIKIAKGEGEVKPSGIKRNNPGNLRVPGSNTEFQSFNTLGEGIKAESDQLGRYFNGTSQAAGYKKLTTVSDIITKWAPPSDKNDTSAYIKNVSDALKVGPNDQIDLNDPSMRIKMLMAMNQQEGMMVKGKPIGADVYRQALSEGSFGLDMSKMSNVTPGTVPVTPMQDPNLIRQQTAAMQAANTNPAAQPTTAQAMPMPSNWQQRPGLHSDYIDNVPMLVMNGGALAS